MVVQPNDMDADGGKVPKRLPVEQPVVGDELSR